jgi:hypothetical protein
MDDALAAGPEQQLKHSCWAHWCFWGVFGDF